MERLTGDKNVQDMGMVELAYNSCYAKDGKARYRDYDIDIDARQLAIELLERYAGIPNEFTCDDDFDEAIIGYMSYGIENIEGLIAVFYRNLWAIADLRERLKRYEDTGLTPEKIVEMDKMYQELGKEVMELRKRNLKREIVHKYGAVWCPNCDEYVETYYDYCPYCGQALVKERDNG